MNSPGSKDYPARSDPDKAEPDKGDLISIPYSEISEKTLLRMLESFVLREGTDYGSQEYSLERKVSQVMEQLKNGYAGVVFDPKEETFDIRPTKPRQMK